MDDQVNFLKKSARLSKFINSKNNCSYDLVLKHSDRSFAAKFIRIIDMKFFSRFVCIFLKLSKTQLIGMFFFIVFFILKKSNKL